MAHNKTDSLNAVLRHAVAAFSSQPYGAVRLADLARESKCSLNTIYDAYGDKTGLFFAAMAPQIAEAEAFNGLPLSGPPLTRLFIATAAHIRFMSAPAARGAFRNIISAFSDNPSELSTAMRGRFARLRTNFTALVAAVRAEGQLVGPDDDEIVDSILAAVAWRPMFFALMFGPNEPTGFKTGVLAGRILRPLLTPAGVEVTPSASCVASVMSTRL
jgi:AcrR family transcriptional regulator